MDPDLYLKKTGPDPKSEPKMYRGKLPYNCVICSNYGLPPQNIGSSLKDEDWFSLATMDPLLHIGDELGVLELAQLIENSSAKRIRGCIRISEN